MAHIEPPKSQEGDLMALFSKMIGTPPPPSKSDVFMRRLGKVAVTSLFILFSVCFALGFVTIAVLLVKALVHIL